MKFRFALIVALSFILSACNFTLAEDVTPPPNYVPPTPAPTLGPLFPAQAPNVENGAAIYAEKCLPCHGATGMGDGPQGIQLGVTVTAYGLPEIARSASPAQWYEVVTRGRMDRFMPPFASLNDQERWDVVAYITTLHFSPEEIDKGKQLFEANCAGCSSDFFKDQEKMSRLTEVELARIVKQGNDEVAAFGSNLTDDEVWAVAAYLRTLTFSTSSTSVASSASTSTPEAVTVEATVVPTDAGTPSVEATPIESTPQAEVTSEATAIPQPGFGTVSGAVENRTKASLPSDLKITLRGFDHGADPSTGPQEVVTLDGTLNADGRTYSFGDIEIPTNRIFIAETTINGFPFQSEFAIVEEGATIVTLPAIYIYDTTEDTSALVVDETRIFFEYSSDNTIQVFGVYSFRNTGDKIIQVPMNANGELPFIKAPESSSGFGFEPMQDSENLISTESGFAIPPSEGSYGLVTFSSVTKTDELDFSQKFILPAATVTVFMPEGVEVKNSQMADLGVQAVQNFNFQIYEAGSIAANSTLSFTITGEPKEATAATTPEAANPNDNILIAAGALGIALILAGLWMYLRDRNRVDEDEEEDNGDEFESSEEVMDAILTLDDQHRAKKISDDAYQKRRAELKEILKGMI